MFDHMVTGVEYLARHIPAVSEYPVKFEYHDIESVVRQRIRDLHNCGRMSLHVGSTPLDIPSADKFQFTDECILWPRPKGQRTKFFAQLSFKKAGQYQFAVGSDHIRLHQNNSKLSLGTYLLFTARPG